VVPNAPGPVEEIALHGDWLVVESKKVILGTGRALVCWTPYWNQHLLNSMRL
jgi:hypothetical protein